MCYFKSSTCEMYMVDFQAWFCPQRWFLLDLSLIYCLLGLVASQIIDNLKVIKLSDLLHL